MNSRLTLAGTLIPILFVLSSVSSFAYVAVTPPTRAVIAADLIGRKLSEGMDNGYFPSDWYWEIIEGEIKALKIVHEDISENYCSYVVAMTLQKQTSPTKYSATVQMDYSLIKNKWQLVLVKSKGVKIIRTDRYLDCISTSKRGSYSDVWVKNNVDTPMIVGGVSIDYGSQEWKKFSLVVNGMNSDIIYNSSGGCRIHFVEPL